MKIRKKNLISFTATLFLFASGFTYAQSAAQKSKGVEGNYVCMGCKGYLEVTKVKDNYQLKLLVGAGSCGGTIISGGKAKILNQNTLGLSYKVSGSSCQQTFQFSNGGVMVSDSCFSEKTDSTCDDYIGEYKKW